MGHETDEYIRSLPYITETPPLPSPPSPHIKICWDKERKEWFYIEAHIPLLEEKNPLDDILDYKALRKLEYPPETDYLDAITKSDYTQLERYFQACREVKRRFPKTLEPITRRDYYVKKLGLRSDKPIKEWKEGDGTIEYPQTEIEVIREGMDHLKQDIDTLKVARTLAKSEIGKVKSSITSLAKQIDSLPAFEAMNETESIKANLATTNERLYTLQASLDSVISALKRRYIM